MKYSRKQQHRSNRIFSWRRSALFLFAVLLTGGGITGYVIWKGHNNDDTTNTSHSRRIDQDKTRQEESEGETFPVPDNVPKDAIKNYELLAENEQYKIRRDRESGSYLITLYAIINRPDQYDMYKEQLGEYKRNALQFLKDRGVDTTKAEIKYEPDEAENL